MTSYYLQTSYFLLLILVFSVAVLFITSKILYKILDPIEDNSKSVLSPKDIIFYSLIISTALYLSLAIEALRVGFQTIVSSHKELVFDGLICAVKVFGTSFFIGTIINFLIFKLYPRIISLKESGNIVSSIRTAFGFGLFTIIIAYLSSTGVEMLLDLLVVDIESEMR